MERACVLGWVVQKMLPGTPDLQDLTDPSQAPAIIGS